jgi:hypothetical protein
MNNVSGSVRHVVDEDFQMTFLFQSMTNTRSLYSIFAGNAAGGIDTLSTRLRE